ncbi:MAG: nuclear transport factor 2 family protein [Ignavibacteriae bacterium]|nr:nuclear transport factor 2 family protein [Ignavibacteriota bacterium]MCB9215008.1 nuclear transport factor 2 family protein [Ignavibacteria bacterium]
MESGMQILENFQSSLQSGNDLWKELIADDVRFEGPVDQVTGKENFIQLNERFFPMVRGYEFLRGLEGENSVSTEVKFKVATPDDGELDIHMAEFYDFEEGKIKQIKVFYDAEEFRKAFGITCK